MSCGNIKTKVALVFLFIGVLIAFGLFVDMTRLRRLGFSISPDILLFKYGSGLQAVLIDTPPHPPWAQSHVINAEIDVENKRIRVCRYYVLWHPFSDHLSVGPTLVLTDFPKGSTYEIEYWDGKEFMPLGKLFLGTTTKDMKWFPNA